MKNKIDMKTIMTEPTLKKGDKVKWTTPYPDEIGSEYEIYEIFPHTIGDRNFFTVKLHCYNTSLGIWAGIETRQIDSEDELTIIRS